MQVLEGIEYMLASSEVIFDQMIYYKKATYWLNTYYEVIELCSCLAIESDTTAGIHLVDFQLSW